jgi:starch synthase
MRIAQTVFGVFHHFELARQLEERGHLQTIYSTFPWKRLKREGLSRDKVQTFPWFHVPEILMLRMKYQNEWLLDQLSYANALAFDEWTLRRVRQSEMPDALIAISGSSLATGRCVQREGGLMICDRGSSHMRYQVEIVSEEYRRWGVDMPVADLRDVAREVEIYETADAITVPSTFAGESFVSHGVPREKIHVIPYGVRLEKFARVGEPPKDRFEVLFAGSVSLRKGFPYLLEAFARVAHGAKRLRVAGALHPTVRNVLERLPRKDVEFLGNVSQERMAELMSTSHMMVLPSIEEGLALVQGQALACGCPVLASTNTGAQDLFTDGVEGFIVAVGDVAAMTARMQQLAEDPALQARMSEAALSRVRYLGGWREYGDRWERLLFQLTGSPPPTK